MSKLYQQIFARRLAGLLPLVAFVAAGALWAGDAQAQGFGVYEQGTCAMGRGGATVAEPCDDGSAIFFNPAGLAGSRGATVSAGVTLITAAGDFTDDATGASTDLDNDPIPVPHAFLAYGLDERLALGLGVYVPYGLGTRWPVEFEGRFLGYDNSVQSIYIQPTAAYRITDRISVGAGLTVVVGAIEINQRADLAAQSVGGLPLSLIGVPAGTDFADARLEAGGATGIGGNFGVAVEATDRLRLGARFTTPVKLSYEGDATFTPVAFGTSTWTLPAGNPFGAPAGTPVDAITLPAGNPFGVPAGTPLNAVIQGAVQQQFTGALRAQSVETEIEMPAQLVVGVGFQATERLLVLADYQWTGWSSFETVPIDFEAAPDRVLHEHYEDTHGLRLGAEYALDDAFTLRAGFITHTAAAPDETVTPLLPEGPRYNVTLGLGWQPTAGVGLNVAYQYLAQSDRDGRVHDDPAGQPPTTALNSGVYSFMAHLVGATLTLRF